MDAHNFFDTPPPRRQRSWSQPCMTVRPLFNPFHGFPEGVNMFDIWSKGCVLSKSGVLTLQPPSMFPLQREPTFESPSTSKEAQAPGSPDYRKAFDIEEDLRKALPTLDSLLEIDRWAKSSRNTPEIEDRDVNAAKEVWARLRRLASPLSREGSEYFADPQPSGVSEVRESTPVWPSGLKISVEGRRRAEQPDMGVNPRLLNLPWVPDLTRPLAELRYASSLGDWTFHTEQLLEDYAAKQLNAPPVRKVYVDLNEPSQFVGGMMKMLIDGGYVSSGSDSKEKTKRPRKVTALPNRMLLENYINVNKMARQYLRTRFKIKPVPDAIAVLLTITLNNFYEAHTHLMEAICSRAVENMQDRGSVRIGLEDFAFGFEFHMSQEMPFFAESGHRIRDTIEALGQANFSSGPQEPYTSRYGRLCKPSAIAQSKERPRTPVSAPRSPKKVASPRSPKSPRGGRGRGRGAARGASTRTRGTDGNSMNVDVDVFAGPSTSTRESISSCIPIKSESSDDDYEMEDGDGVVRSVKRGSSSSSFNLLLSHGGKSAFMDAAAAKARLKRKADE